MFSLVLCGCSLCRKGRCVAVPCTGPRFRLSLFEAIVSKPTPVKLVAWAPVLRGPSAQIVWKCFSNHF